MHKIIEKQGWLHEKASKRLIEIFNQSNAEFYFVGGCVRKSLVNQLYKNIDDMKFDIDIATNLTPDKVTELFEKSGCKVIPTGIKHGTVTILIEDRSFEITSYRRDIKTDGRHAVVEYSTSAKEDSTRRDFTINAIYCDSNGNIFDPQNGVEDLRVGNLRFIGDAKTRIKEDGLRILRFFRFLAELQIINIKAEKDSLTACYELADMMNDLSGERIYQEMQKLLSAEDPTETLRLMLDNEKLCMAVLGSKIVGNIKKIKTEYVAENIFLLRLTSLIKTNNAMDFIVQRWLAKLSHRKKLAKLVADKMQYGEEENNGDIKNILFDLPDEYLENSQLLQKDSFGRDLILQRFLIASEKIQQLKNSEQLRIEKWKEMRKIIDDIASREFPIKSIDLQNIGFGKNKILGEALRTLRVKWIREKCTISKEELLKHAKEILQKNQ